MKRPSFKRMLGLERLEERQVLSAGGPSPQAQYMLELINQARTNPAAAAARYTQNLDSSLQDTLNFYNVDLNAARQQIAGAQVQQPLAWNSTLANAAQNQSQDELNQGVQTHLGADGSDLSARLNKAGYSNRASGGENTFAYANSVDQAMDAFMLDWGVPDKGHFRNLLEPGTSIQNSFKDVGIGIVNSNKTGFGPQVITQDFGRQNGEQAELLGVVFNDPNGDNFYEPGEGVGNATIQATNLQSGQQATVQSWDAGGYQIPLAPGQYQVTATVNGQVVGNQQVSIGTTNVKVDFNLNQPTIMPMVTPPAPTPAPAPTPPPATPPPAPTPPAPTPPVAPTPPAPQVVTPPPKITAPTAPAQPTITFAAPTIANVAPYANTSRVGAVSTVAPTTSPTPTPKFNVNWITTWSQWKA
jgi:uncharacterized protein YkwD